MLLPNADKAVIDVRKLTAYALNHTHPEGKHKARVFKALLGLDISNADELVKAIREAILNHDARLQTTSAYGTKYAVDFKFTLNGKTAWIRTGWVVECIDNIPRLVTCFVKL